MPTVMKMKMVMIVMMNHDGDGDGDADDADDAGDDDHDDKRRCYCSDLHYYDKPPSNLLIIGNVRLIRLVP